MFKRPWQLLPLLQTVSCHQNWVTWHPCQDPQFLKRSQLLHQIFFAVLFPTPRPQLGPEKRLGGWNAVPRLSRCWLQWYWCTLFACCLIKWFGCGLSLDRAMKYHILRHTSLWEAQWFTSAVLSILFCMLGWMMSFAPDFSTSCFVVGNATVTSSEQNSYKTLA